MGMTWIKEPVTAGRLRFFAPTEEGSYPVSGRLECLECDPQVALLFHHAGLQQDLAALQVHRERPVPVDRQYKNNWVRLAPSSTPEGAAWSASEDLFACCVALLSLAKDAPHGYEFRAYLKPEGPYEPISVQFTDGDFPRHFFAAATFQATTAIVVNCGTPYAQRYMSRDQFEAEVGRSQLFGEVLAERRAP